MRLKLILLLGLAPFFNLTASAALGTHSNDIASGTVPSAINYQARITESGFPVTGSRTMTFKLYDASSGGNELWAGSAQTVSVVQGLLSTTIAISTSALVGSKTKYLEVAVGATTLSPREPLMAVPYAIIAKSLEDDRLTISTITVGTLVVRSTSAIAGHVALAVQNNAGSELMRVQQDGSVGIGTTAPATKFHVAQAGVAASDGMRLANNDATPDGRNVFFTSDGIMHFNGLGAGDAVGDATLSAAGAWTNASDRAYKQNIADLRNGLHTVLQLQPRSYTVKGIPQIGFVAQEIEQHVPEVVSGRQGSKGIAYGLLTALLVEAIKEQQAEIEALKARLAELKK